MDNLKSRTIKSLEEWKEKHLTLINFRIRRLEKYIESSNYLLDRSKEGTQDYQKTQKRIDNQWKEYKELKRLEKNIKGLRIIGSVQEQHTV